MLEFEQEEVGEEIGLGNWDSDGNVGPSTRKHAEVNVHLRILRLGILIL